MSTKKERMCTARTGWVVTLAVGLAKLAVSGMTITGVVSFETFDYAGFSLILAAVGGIYWGRQDSKRKERQGV